jgi:Tfp pilus assembly protein PilF
MSNAYKYIAEAKTRGYQFSEMDLRRALNIYLKVNDYENIKWVYESLVKIAPKNAQYHASLAVAYARLGDKAGAIKEAQTAVQLDKNFAGEADAFIKSLGK